MNINTFITGSRIWSELSLSAQIKYKAEWNAKSLYKLSHLAVTIADGCLMVGQIAGFSISRNFFYAQLALRSVVVVSGTLVDGKSPRWGVAAQACVLTQQILRITEPKQLAVKEWGYLLSGIEFGVRYLRGDQRSKVSNLYTEMN